MVYSEYVIKHHLKMYTAINFLNKKVRYIWNILNNNIFWQNYDRLTLNQKQRNTIIHK